MEGIGVDERSPDLHLESRAAASNGLKEETLIASEWSPRVAISAYDREAFVNAELPQMRRADVKVTVDQGVLTIAGERRMEEEEKSRRYHGVESE